MTDALLPSWRPSATRDALLGFLHASVDIPVDERVAVFDIDGTLWCEKPAYVQQAFFIEELAKRASADPALGERPEYAALLRQDRAAMDAHGLPRLAMALAELFDGMEADEFAARSRRFVLEAPHPTLGVPFAATVYQPMLELLDELRGRQFSTFLVTGAGTEFVRAVSQLLYGVPPEGVVGTLVGYEYLAGATGPRLVRTTRLIGAVNEGPDKVVHIQQHLGRRPVFAAGNSAGDREMIEWAIAAPHPSLGMLIHHDDAEREVAYASVAGTIDTDEAIVDVARRQEWLVASMRHDWSQVFSIRR